MEEVQGVNEGSSGRRAIQVSGGGGIVSRDPNKRKYKLRNRKKSNQIH